MDELKVLREMRSKAPPPSEGSKEQLWNQLEQKIDGAGHEQLAKGTRFVRTLRTLVIGSALLAVLAISPIGPAVADRVDGLFGSGESATAVTSPENRQAIDTMHEKMRALYDRPVPDGTPAERSAAGVEQLNAIASEAATAAGGGSVELPPGVVTRIPPNPLSGIDRKKDAAFCAEAARDRAAEGLPADPTCELTNMVQDGELPPGDYTQVQLDKIFGAEK